MEMLKNFVIYLAILFVGCSKSNDVFDIKQEYAGKSIWPISISLGPDTTYIKTDSISLYKGTAYIPTCGTAPSTEAPIIGVQVYQIAGPSAVTIQSNVANPWIKGLTYGKYTFVGHAYQIGFRTCDSTYRDDHAYDTINITVLKSRKKK